MNGLTFGHVAGLWILFGFSFAFPPLLLGFFIFLAITVRSQARAKQAQRARHTQLAVQAAQAANQAAHDRRMALGREFARWSV